MGKALVRCCSATKIWTVSLKLWRRKKMRFPDQSESQGSKRTQIAIEPKMERMFLLPAGFAGCSLPSPPELVGKDVCVCVCLFAFGFSIIKSLFICSLRVLFASCAARDKLVQFFPPSADYRQFCFVTFTFASFLNTLKHFLYLSYFLLRLLVVICCCWISHALGRSTRVTLFLLFCYNFATIAATRVCVSGWVCVWLWMLLLFSIFFCISRGLLFCLVFTENG